MRYPPYLFYSPFPLLPNVVRSSLLGLPIAVAGFAAHADAPAPSTFETPEYQALKALPILKAASLYARGGTGKGVTVALIDSGLDLEHPSFQGRIADPGYDYVRKAIGTYDRLLARSPATGGNTFAACG